MGFRLSMDLAKALPLGRDGLEQIILIPSTYSAVLASSTSHSLFLDSAEETLVPLPSEDIANVATNCLRQSSLRPASPSFSKSSLKRNPSSEAQRCHERSTPLAGRGKSRRLTPSSSTVTESSYAAEVSPVSDHSRRSRNPPGAPCSP